MGVVETWPSPTGKGSEYHLTPAGKDMERVVEALGKWAIEWLFDDIRPHDVDVVTLTWWMHRRIRPERFPPRRTVIEFRHTAPEPQTIWIVLDRGEASVCTQHPGFESDLVVTTTTGALSDVFNGFCHWDKSVGDGLISVAGVPRLVRALPTWFQWSPFADTVYERATR
jgi:hypothetical protein